MKYTFGKTIAAQRLENLVADNPIARRRISTLVSKFTAQMLSIVSAKDPDTVRLCWELLRDYTLRRIDVKKHLTDDMKTYTKNVIISRYRIYCHNFDELVSIMESSKEKKELDF